MAGLAPSEIAAISEEVCTYVAQGVRLSITLGLNTAERMLAPGCEMVPRGPYYGERSGGGSMRN